MQIDWGARLIYVYKAYAFMTDLGGNIYEMDTNAFRLALKDAEDSEEGMPHPDTHSHNTTVTVGGVTLAHVVEIINGYTITFEDGQYAICFNYNALIGFQARHSKAYWPVSCSSIRRHAR